MGSKWRATIRIYEGIIQYTACLEIMWIFGCTKAARANSKSVKDSCSWSRERLPTETCQWLKNEAKIKKLKGWHRSTAPLSYGRAKIFQVHKLTDGDEMSEAESPKVN